MVNTPSPTPVVPPCDLVVLLARSPWGQEIRYALRSIERHCHGIGQVWIVGHLPEFLDRSRVIHVPEERVCPRGVFVESEARRYVNELPGLSDDYVIAPDDCYLLGDVDVAELGPLWLEDLSRIVDRGAKPWQRMLWRTHDLLVHMGFPAHNYEAHVPTLVNRERFRSVAERFTDIESVAYHRYHGICAVSAYWNMVDDPPPRRRADDHRVGFVGPDSVRTVSEVAERVAGKAFLYHDDAGLTPALQQFLAERFPSPSEYEIADARSAATGAGVTAIRSDS